MTELDIERPPTIEDVFHAYYDCRRQKRNSWNALKFEEHLERNLIQLHKELADGSWRPGRLSCFVITFPKPREIWASDFRDRIVQCVFYNRWRERFHNSFIYDSYACIPGRGTLMGSKRVEKMMLSITNNWQKSAYVLQADFANFFVSINKEILEEILFKKISGEWDQWLCRQILWTDPTDGALIKSNRQLLSQVPIHKSLFNAAPNKGLPIGNLTSQFFANIYLNEVDQFAKHCLKIKYYGRYVDDIVTLGEDIKILVEKSKALDDFAKTNLDVAFHPNKTYVNKIEHGINFIGYILKPWAKYVRRSTMANLMRKLEEPDFFRDADVLASVNSYLGMLKHVKGYKARRKICQRLEWLGYPSDPSLTKLLS